MTKHKYKRKKLYINPRFQNRLIFMSLISAVVFSALYFLAINLVETNLLELSETLRINPEDKYFTEVQSLMEMVRNIFLGLSIFFIAIVFGMGMYISHKIAGPMYRLKHYLIAHQNDGECSKLTFREGDFFMEIPEEFNKFLKARGILKDWQESD